MRLFSNGNRKIGKDTLIFNITPFSHCPAKSMCKVRDICYAKQAEIMYPQVLPYRLKQEEWWEQVNALQFAAEVMSIKKRKQNIIRYLRINESGDYKNQDDVDKIYEIAGYLSRYGMIVYSYTARKDLNWNHRPDNLVITGSHFMLDNKFVVVPRHYQKQKGDIICPMDCSKCNLCKTKGKIAIKCRKH